MASVQVTIQRDNGTNITASGVVPDELIADTAAMLGAMLFDAAAAPAAASAEEPAP
jgi:hypothetical protein